MRKHNFYQSFAVGLLTLLLAACIGTTQVVPTLQPPAAEEEAEAPAPEEEAEEPAEAEAPDAGEPVMVRIGWAGSPDTLNPGTAILAEAYTLFELVYDSMYQLEFDGSYTPELAESVEVSEDGTEWTFHIRDGFTWHDGEPLTAHDIAFSYNLYRDHEDFPFLNVYTAYFDTIEAPDDNTVVITLVEAIPNMESQLVFLYVLPQHIWSELEFEAVSEFENEEMIGSGPFRLAEYTQNEFVRLETFSDHLLYSPNIDGAVFQTFDNQDALVQALRTG